MDNDSSIKKNLVKVYKAFKFKCDYAGCHVDTEAEGNDRIAVAICSGKPFMAVRLGAVEAKCVDKWMKYEGFTDENMDQIHYAAGVFPQNEEIVTRFCEKYTEALKSADMLGLWSVVGEKRIMKAYCPKAALMPLRSIEPYYYAQPWSKELEEKKVLVVHPFVESILSQYKRREQLFANQNIMPQFGQLKLIKAVQSNGGGCTKFQTWFNALRYMEEQIAQSDFDVGIIGAGAYGLPLASFIKSMGKQAIQMAGATQILFGIKGKRWDRHPIISSFYNDAWIRPNKEETPPQIDKVEGGSYW